MCVCLCLFFRTTLKTENALKPAKPNGWICFFISGSCKVILYYIGYFVNQQQRTTSILRSFCRVFKLKYPHRELAMLAVLRRLIKPGVANCVERMRSELLSLVGRQVFLAPLKLRSITWDIWKRADGIWYGCLYGFTEAPR